MLCLTAGLAVVLVSSFVRRAVTAMSDDNSLDLRLIPEFSGAAQELITEWLDKVEFECQLRKDTDDLATILLLKLTGNASIIWKHLAEEKRKDVEAVNNALISAFSSAAFQAYEEFVARRL